MKSAWDFAVHVLNTMPPWLAAILVGWAISVGMTQASKFALPLSVNEGVRELVARLLAFTSAAIPAGVYYTSRSSDSAAAALVMIGAGLWSPLAFAVLQAALRRYFPWLADVLSADKRGKLKFGPADGANQ